MSDNTPVIKRRRTPSAVWFLPILAAIIAGWLVYQNYRDQGVLIEVMFDSATGLEANKTKVLYRGLPTGVVKSLKIDEDLRRVRAVIEMVPETADTLTDEAQFWLVKPQVSLSGVRGLETLLSGHYIGFQPGMSGKTTDTFIANDQPPPPLKDSDGLYLTLTADNARSVYQGAKVYYRDIEVGEVLSHTLSPNGQRVLIETYIEPRYTGLIKENTRFWNASGIRIKADLPKIDIQVDSLASIIAGGIHFSPPDEDAKPATNGTRFSLFDDYEAAQDGINVKLRFPSATEISEGTVVMSRGVQIGRVKEATVTDDFKYLDTVLFLDPRAKDLLRESSRFWLQKPQLSITNLSNIGDLLRGSFIELDPGQGAEKLSFTALNLAPAKRQLAMGKSFELKTDTLGSITKGSPILYRQMPVGEVLSYELGSDGSHIIIHAAIEQQYSHLLSGNARFWNASGIKVNASLRGVSVSTESATSLLLGGISFFNPGDGKKSAPKSSYTLYDDYQSASDNGKLSDQRFAGALKIRLHAEETGSLKAGDPVLYKQIRVGEITDVTLNKDGNAVTLYALIEKPYKHLVHEGTRFWNASGISADVSLRQLDLKMESLEALISGGIAFANFEEGAAIKTNHLFTLYPNESLSELQPLGIIVTFPAGKDLQPLADIRYKGQTVGKVRNVKVIEQGKRIKAFIDLYRDGHFLAQEGSRFWVVSSQIRLSAIENPEGLILGNYVEASEGNGKAQFQFKGLTKPPAFRNYEGLNLIVQVPELGSLMKGSPVFFRQVPVGRVTNFDLPSVGQHVNVFVNINPEYASYVRADSEFENISGVRMDLSLFGGLKVKAESLETIIGGGLSFTSPTDSPKAASGAIFTLKDD
ncbi:MlaD family protein [Neptunomonas phycophila]|uniref:MlaD family protein n=1 Tax=Neptunomonas phycophila TaxID=1572645 RepID=UPI0009489912|nr:MlaD family protein [Neptunomonas phycophila]